MPRRALHGRESSGVVWGTWLTDLHQDWPDGSAKHLRRSSAALCRSEPPICVRFWTISQTVVRLTLVRKFAAGASQRLPATNKAGPVTTDQAARWALGAIAALLPNAIRELSVPQRTNMVGELAKAADDQKPSQEALKRLLHTRLVPATVAACWDGARAKLAGGGAEARGARDTCDTCHARWALLRKHISHIPFKLFRDARF